MDRPLDIRTSPRMPSTVSQRQIIEEFWRKRKEEIKAIEDFGERAIPMTRLKKVICAEKGKMMMTFDIPSFLTKACEIFVQELAFRAWMCASSHHRSIILDSDIAEAIATTESYDFLKDILHSFREEHNSIPCSKSTKKCHRSNNQPSTSHHYPLNQVAQFHLQYAEYPPFVRTPLHLPPTNVHLMSLPFPFPLQQATPPLTSTTVTPTRIVTPTMIPHINYMATSLGFFGNGINTTVPNNFVASNNIVASGVMTHPLQVRARATTSIPSTSFYMNMINAFAPAYDVGGATNNNIAAAPGQHVAIELDHFLPEVAETASTMHACNAINANDNIDGQQEEQIDFDDGQQGQQHQLEETVANHPLNALDGTLDVAVASAGATNAGGDNYDVNWDEFVIPDDFFMSTFWEDIMMEDNPAPLTDATTSNDLLASNMQDLEGSRNESHLFDDISSTEAQAAGSAKAPM